MPRTRSRTARRNHHRHQQRKNTRSLITRNLTLRADSIDQEKRTVEAVLATEHRVRVFDPESWRIIEEILVARGAEIPTQIPLLENHFRWSLRDVLGSSRSMSVDGANIVGTLHFADDADSNRAWAKVRDGHLTDVSVGYRAIDYVDIKPNTTSRVDGQEYTAGDLPLRITKRWKLTEVSLVPIGADEHAKVREAPDDRGYERGENLATAMSDAIANHADLTHEELVDEMATAADVTTEYVEDVIGGDIDAPEIEVLEAFAEVLGIDSETLISAAEDDGADYSDDEEEEEQDEERADDEEEEDDGDEDERAESDDDDEDESGERSQPTQPAGRGRTRERVRGARTTSRTSRTRSGEPNMPKPKTGTNRTRRSERQTTRSREIDLDAIRAEERAKERKRVSRIEEHARTAGLPTDDEIVRRAIDENWTANRAAAQFLRAMRDGRREALNVPGGDNGNGYTSVPAAHTRRQGRDEQLRALTAGLTMRAGLPVVDSAAPDNERRAQEQAAEQGHRFRDVSLIDVARQCLLIEGRSIPHTRDDLVRSAVSTGALVGVFSAIVNKKLLTSFQEHPDTTEGWVREVDVPNFKKNERTRMEKRLGLTKVARGGKAPHADVSDATEEYKIARYGEQFVVDDQDIIDDEMNALLDRPTEMGFEARRLRPDLVYSILLGNPDMRDSVALFHTNHNNLFEAGSALSAAAVEHMLQLIGTQTENGVNLNLVGQYLIVPRTKGFLAKRIVASTERGDSSDQGTSNPLNAHDLPLQVRTDSRLDNGVTDPDSGVTHAADGAQWFCSAPASMHTIEVGYRSGTGRVPLIRPFVLDRGQWGIGWDVAYDIGAKALDWRGLAKGTGAAAQ